MKLKKKATGGPQLAQIATGPQNISNMVSNMSQGFIQQQTPTQFPVDNVGQSNTPYNASGSGQQINWDHVLASQVAQNLVGGAVSRFSPNSQQNTIQQFNKQHFAPMNYLPYTPNVSQQAQFGTMEDGGEIDPPVKAKPRYSIPNAYMFDMGHPNYTPTAQDSALYKQTFGAAQANPSAFNYQQMNQAAMNNYLIHNELGYDQNRANYLRDANKAAAVWDAQHPYRRGGAIGGLGYWPPRRMDMGGGTEGNPFTQDNIYASNASGIKDADLVDRLNAALTGGKYTGSAVDLSPDALNLVQSANIWRQTHQGGNPQQNIQGWFNRPSDGGTADSLRQRLNKIGYGADAMYNSTPNTSVKMEQGGTFDMGESMRKWIMDDEEATPQPEEQPQQEEQQQMDPETMEALKFAQYAQMMGIDQLDQEGDQPAEQYMYEQGGPVTDGELYHLLGDEVDDHRLDQLKKGGWIQSANASIKRRGTKGVCTGSKFGGPSCRAGTRRYALAKTFRKMAHHRKKHAMGGLINFEEGGEYDLQPEQIIGLIGQGYNIDV